MERVFKIWDRVEGIAMMMPEDRRVVGIITRRCDVCGNWVVRDEAGEDVHVRSESLRPYVPPGFFGMDKEVRDDYAPLTLLLRDGSQANGYYCAAGGWNIYRNNKVPSQTPKDGEVIAWKPVAQPAFRVGDRVVYTPKLKWGAGTIVARLDATKEQEWTPEQKWLVKFDKPAPGMHDGNCITDYTSDRKDCYWCRTNELFGVAEQVVEFSSESDPELDAIRYAAIFDDPWISNLRKFFSTDLFPVPMPVPPAPKLKVRWCVAAEFPTTITYWHDTYESALAEAKRLNAKTGQIFRVLEIAAEIEPGAPVIKERK